MILQPGKALGRKRYEQDREAHHTNKETKWIQSTVFSYQVKFVSTFGINVILARQGAWKEEVDDRRREGSWDILDHPDSITGYPDDPDELEDDLK